MPTEKPTAHAVPGMPVDDEPCKHCGRRYAEAKHFVRAPSGIKCTAPGCKGDVFERCFDLSGNVLSTRCVPGNHVVRA